MPTTTYKKVLVSKLQGASLDWAVAKCEGFENNLFRGIVVEPTPGIGGGLPRKWKPTTNWSQGGPIIEREKIATYQPKEEDIWYSYPRLHGEGTKLSFGPTTLIAAMRCYVASKLGNEVEIPEELLNAS